MTEKRVNVGVTAALLAGTVWYAFDMASYPSNAGRIPLIVALVMATALVLQLFAQLRPRRSPEPAPVVGAGGEVTEDDTLALAERRAHEVEEAASGFDVLLALDRIKWRRLAAIVTFSLLFYFFALMVGFVISTGVLITAFMLVARERAWLAVVSGLLSSTAVYVLVVVVLDMPALDGYLF